MTHTPGPWEARPNDGQIVLNGSNCYHIQEIFNDVGGFNPADIRLMGAAPEMLAALCEVRDAFAALNWDGDENWRHWDATRVDQLIAGTLHVVNKAIGLTKEGSNGEDRRVD
jgi:hypothetical protein